MTFHKIVLLDCLSLISYWRLISDQTGSMKMAYINNFFGERVVQKLFITCEKCSKYNLRKKVFISLQDNHWNSQLKDDEKSTSV